MLTKNTSVLIEPRGYELGTIRTEMGFLLGRSVSWTLVSGNKDCLYEAASNPVDTTN